MALYRLETQKIMLNKLRYRKIINYSELTNILITAQNSNIV